MKIQISFASVVRSFRSLGLALPIAALLCAAPLTRSARAAVAPSHIYLFDSVFGLTDVTATFDGSSVVSITGEVIFVNFVTVPNNGGGATGAGGHTTDIAGGATGAGGHTTDIVGGATGAGGHTTDLVLDDANSIVGIVTP